LVEDANANQSDAARTTAQLQAELEYMRGKMGPLAAERDTALSGVASVRASRLEYFDFGGRV
jgi:hypothetical protein